MTIAERFYVLFSGYSKKHGYYGNLTERELTGKVKASPEDINTRQGGATISIWEQHLQGLIGLGVIPLRDDNSVVFVAIDIDDYNIDFTKMLSKIREHRLPLVLCRSKSGGIHAYLFLKEPLPAKYVQDKVKSWMATLAVGVSEYFPKQTERLETKDNKKDSVGNWINMPYKGIKTGDMQRACYTGDWLSAEDFLDYAESLRQSYEDLEKIVLNLSDYFSDGPVCLQVLATEGYSQGMRNNTLLESAIYLKKKYTKSWKEELYDYNKMFSETSSVPSLPVEEVATIIRNIEKQDYQHRCNQDPIKSRCDRTTCITREFGVKTDSGFVSVILEDMVLLKDPNGGDAALFISVNGKRLRLNNLDELLNQSRFQKICVSEVQVLPNTLKKMVWEKTLQVALKSVKIEFMPEEASLEGQFYILLQEFLENKSKMCNDIEWVLTGQVYIELCEEKYYAIFASNHFFDFLNRRGFNKFSQNKMWGLLKDKNCESRTVRIKGSQKRLWYIPIDNFQTGDFEVPSFDKAY